MEDETVWLTQAQLAELFQMSRVTITEHIDNIFKEGELEEVSVCRKFRHTAADGKDYDTTFYNLDVIISVGYRVKSLQGTKFRQWATARLKEYIVKGFTMNDELLKQAGVGNYFQELLARIRDIRSSEKVFSRMVLDIYATSIDSDPKLAEAIFEFCEQNLAKYKIPRIIEFTTVLPKTISGKIRRVELRANEAVSKNNKEA